MGNYDAIKDLHAERQTFFVRALVALIACGIAIAILVSRLVSLQVFQHADFLTRSNENRMRLVVVPPVRGLIFDRNGAVLADNVPSFVLELIPEQVDDIEDTLKRLSRIVSLDHEDMERFRDRLRRTPRYRGVPIRTRLTMDEVARFEINRHDFSGVDIRAGLTRRYPLGESAAHVVGYVGGVSEEELREFGAEGYRGTTHIGKNGVERSHEVDLHGKVGAKIVETNATGRPLRDLNYDRGAPGQSLYLTVDAQLQVAAEAALGDREGAVVAIQPSSGEVLALVSKPGFDPHLFVDGIGFKTYKALNDNPTKPLFNRALQGQYPPGSTIKPLMAMAGLEYAVTTEHERVFCPGFYELPGSSRKYRDWKRRGHGWMDMDRAIAESCDVYFYKLAEQLGVDRIEAMLSQFGLGSATGLDLPGEKGGLLPSRDWKRAAKREAWYPGETLNIGIGQGYMMMTPVQLAQAMALVAMRGQGYVPHIVHAEEDPLSHTMRRVAPTPVPTIETRDPRAWSEVIHALIEVTTTQGGTGYRAFHDAPYLAAGKSGSAQVAGLAQDEAAPELSSVPKHLRDHALFVAFAPVESPQIAVAVIVEHGGGGGAVAGPVVRAVIDDWLLRDADPTADADAGNAAGATVVTPAAAAVTTAPGGAG